jgi:hypothetical protein
VTKLLTRHFFDALFDLGFLTREGADAFTRVVIGVVAVLITLGLWLTRMYTIVYAPPGGVADPTPYVSAVSANTMTAIGLPMWIAAFVTVLISHSLVPDETDYRVLMALPISQAFIFRAKLLALAIFCGIFIAGSLLGLTLLVIVISASRYSPNILPVSVAAYWAVGTAGCLFSVLTIVAVNGALTILVPRSRVHGVAAAVKSAMLAALMLAIPLVLALPAQARAFAAHSRTLYVVPPAWFLGIERLVFGGADVYTATLGRIGIAAFLLVSAVATLSYLVLYRRFDRVMLKTVEVARRRSRWRGTITDFTLATLRRSSLHQGVLIAVSALGLTLALNRINGQVATYAVLGAVWLLMFFIGIATRAAIALPIDQRANWVFRMTENDATRATQLSAVTRLMHQTTVIFPVILMVPLEWALFGPRAVMALAMNAVCGLLWVEVLLRGWRRLPFTSSYMPGKQFIAQTAVVGVGTLVLGVTIVGAVALGAARSVTFFTVTSGILGTITYLMRRTRLNLWRQGALEFDDKMPSALELNLYS